MDVILAIASKHLLQIYEQALSGYSIVLVMLELSRCFFTYHLLDFVHRNQGHRPYQLPLDIVDTR